MSLQQLVGPSQAESGELYGVYHAVDPVAWAQPSVDHWRENGRNYTRVAVVKAPLHEVFRLTKHTSDRAWTENPEVVWYEEVLPRIRSTRVGDVFLSNGRAWLVMPDHLQEIPYSSPSARRVYRGHGGEVSAVAWSWDGTRIASGGRDGNVQVWDVKARGEVTAYSHRSGPVTILSWAPDSARIASSNANGTVIVYAADSRTSRLY